MGNSNGRVMSSNSRILYNSMSSADGRILPSDTNTTIMFDRTSGSDRASASPTAPASPTALVAMVYYDWLTLLPYMAASAPAGGPHDSHSGDNKGMSDDTSSHSGDNTGDSVGIAVLQCAEYIYSQWYMYKNVRDSMHMYNPSSFTEHPPHTLTAHPPPPQPHPPTSTQTVSSTPFPLVTTTSPHAGMTSPHTLAYH